MLSSTAEYALRAVLYLAEHPHRQPVRAGELASSLRVPPNYLAKVLHQLARRGVLRSSRGRNGGFELALPPEQLTLFKVVAGFDRLGGRKRCLLGRRRCTAGQPCAAHRRWRGVAEQIVGFFRQTTLQDLLATSNEAEIPSGRTV
jgi:Rrf2 family protein